MKGRSLAGRRSYTVFPQNFSVEPHRLGMQLCSGPERADDVYRLLAGCKTVRLPI
jgi:hypothetical protein